MTAARQYRHQGGRRSDRGPEHYRQHEAAAPSPEPTIAAQPVTTEDGRAALRARLIAVRDDIIAQMARLVPTVDGGLLRMAADADRVIALLDRIEGETA